MDPDCAQHGHGVGTPIYDAVADNIKPWMDTAAITDREAHEMGLSALRINVLRYLWNDVSLPVCGAQLHHPHMVGGVKVTDKHVCLFPPNHGGEVHYAQTEKGDYVWGLRPDERRLPLTKYSLTPQDLRNLRDGHWDRSSG